MVGWWDEVWRYWEKGCGEKRRVIWNFAEKLKGLQEIRVDLWVLRRTMKNGKLNVLVYDGTFSIDPEQLKSTELCKAPLMNTGKKKHHKRTSYIIFNKASLRPLGALISFSSKVRKELSFPVILFP